MTPSNKYVFQDWLLGKVCFGFNIFIPHLAERPVLVTWENFDESDIAKIKQRQKQIFEKRVKKQVKKFKSLFVKSYEGTQAKEQFVLKEIAQIIEILECQISNDKYFSTSHWYAIFENESIKGIQSYYKNVIVRNLPFDYDFIHSDEANFHNIEALPDSIYCQALWDYYMWIEREFSMQTNPVSVGDANSRNYTSKEMALVYIFDTYASGKQLPQNLTEGGNSKKDLMLIGVSRGMKGDTFYRAVVKVLRYDLNSVDQLFHISKDWENVLRHLSSDWSKLSNYLRAKSLLGE